jgi:hypothetical protein
MRPAIRAKTLNVSQSLSSQNMEKTEGWVLGNEQK